MDKKKVILLEDYFDGVAIIDEKKTVESFEKNKNEIESVYFIPKALFYEYLGVMYQ